jgi:hypothetical protein
MSARLCGAEGVHPTPMRMARIQGGIVATIALAVAAVMYVNTPVHSAALAAVSRFDSQALSNHPTAAIADTYLFPSPTTAGDVVAVMDVDPGIPTGLGSSAFFDPAVLYQMKFDDRLAGQLPGALPSEDHVIQFSAGTSASGTQTIYVYGPAAPNQVGPSNTILPLTATLQIGQALDLGSFKFFAGPRSDPFFFDTQQWYNMFPNRNAGSTAMSCLPASFGGGGTCPQGFNGAGTAVPPSNSQAGTNVLSFVVEMPDTTFTQNGQGGKIAYWATTSTASGL